MPQNLNDLITNKEEFLCFLKTKTQFFQQSNAFFRDFQYGIISYAKARSKNVGYAEAEELARQLITSLESAGILKLIKAGSWMLLYPEFRKPSEKPEAPAKPVASAGAPKAPAAPQSTATLQGPPSASQQSND